MLNIWMNVQQIQKFRRVSLENIIVMMFDDIISIQNFTSDANWSPLKLNKILL